jgi:hypothetical protein
MAASGGNPDLLREKKNWGGVLTSCSDLKAVAKPQISLSCHSEGSEYFSIFNKF